MEYLSRIQKRYNLNEVVRVDEPGAGNGYHEYMIQRRVYPLAEKVQVIPIANIVFQHGETYDKNSTRGVLDEDLLEIVRDRLKAFQEGPLETRENACALTHIEEALMWMSKRVEDRAERKVLGTMNQ